MLMYPIFISDDPDTNVPIPSLPGERKCGIRKLEEFLTPLVNKGLTSVLVFALPSVLEKVYGQ